MSHPSFCFNKMQRLLKPAEFKTVFDTAVKKIHSEHCLIFVRVNDKDVPRLGLAITKKKLKHAVVRNRLKRITKEVFRLNQHELANVDLVLIVKKSYTKDCDIFNEIVKIFEVVKLKYPRLKID
ncbi:MULTISPECIES: ribonuclease P protein component [unclassified Moraxella]|uniref:ribonuclease P protein component n=1 Tax=unclassified Moraxella TaxID=2685852 RepID=UPI002B40268A|nr:MULTISPECIES: ribonuclease P protein component [unclassified Moraxella]